MEKLNQRFRSYGISGLEARLEAESRGEKVDIFFPRVHADAAAYQRDHILLEFGGRNRGKPTDTITVSSY
ncbi:nucleotidyl transferase AbiEii/AbiGii toxin family protein, partial [Klebsiella pneumoniae]